MPARQRGRPRPGDRALSARLFLPALATLLAQAAALRGQDPPAQQPPPRLAEEVTVTAARVRRRLAETPASVALLTRDALELTAAPTVDDALRQLPGFSLFRRTGSRTANPTSQGVSLRGLGASGASRALVLADGIPLNDPFGGWVYWARLPQMAIERIEVLRGGASELYGGGAMGGVIQLISRDPREGAGLEAELAAGGAATLDGRLTARAGRGDWAVRLSTSAYQTDGYVPVAEANRGLVDSEAASRHLAVDATLERRLGAGGRVFVRGQAYAEERENGTPLQTNDTQIGTGALGLDWGARERGATSLRAWGSTEVLHQAFSAVSTDRSREELTRQQRVPADALGASVQWSRVIGSRQLLLAGAELRRVQGTTEEVVYAGGAAASTLDAGGRETGAAVFLQDLVQAHPRLVATAALRLDAWSHRDGRTIVTPLASGVAVAAPHPDRDEAALSPRLGLVYRVRPALSLSASGYGAFRGPTLNELYRSFRVGDTLTLANAELGAERLWGGEAGALVTRGRLTLRLTAFSAGIEDAIANVTVTSTPGLVTRRRENVGRTRSRGLEAELELRASRRAVLSAGYALTDARVTRFPADPSLEGRRLPQVPRHQATLQARYEGRLRLGLQARLADTAYEDDRNELPLDPAAQVDLFAGYALSRGVVLFAAAENVFDAEIVAARTPVPGLAPPRQLRAGLRFSR